MGNQFVVYVEVDLPGDSNESWPDSHLGQPSLLYSALIMIDQSERYSLLELTGHGGGAEDNGVIHYDLDGISSARNLIDLLLVKLEDHNP